MLQLSIALRSSGADVMVGRPCPLTNNIAFELLVSADLGPPTGYQYCAPLLLDIDKRVKVVGLEHGGLTLLTLASHLGQPVAGYHSIAQSRWFNTVVLQWIIVFLAEVMFWSESLRLGLWDALGYQAPRNGCGQKASTDRFLR